MERRQEIQRAVYVMVAADAAVLSLLLVAVLYRPLDLMPFVAVCFTALLISNFLFLRNKLRKVGSPTTEEAGAQPRSRRFSVYACSAIFFIGTLRGALMISQGELPRAILPLLLVPLSIAVYCLKTALRTGARR